MKKEDNSMFDAADKVFDAADAAFKEANKAFKNTDGLWRTMGSTTRKGVTERQDGKLVVPLTLRNRLKLIGFAFSRAKKIRF